MTVEPTDTTTGPERADRLRQEMADRLIQDAHLTVDAVTAELKTAPRHGFVTEASWEEACAPDMPAAIEHDAQGRCVSSLSLVHSRIVMLEQADITPGERVPEVGPGGYDIALIVELVGDGGEVTPVDIDSDINDDDGESPTAVDAERSGMFHALSTRELQRSREAERRSRWSATTRLCRASASA